MRLTYKNYLSLLVTLCALSLGMALMAEHFFDIKPCALCHYQRYVFLATAGVGITALLLNKALDGIKIATGLFFINGGIAFYQVLVEQHILPAPETCRSIVPSSENLETLTAQLLNQSFVPCDQVAWSLFGISFAGYNVLFCFGLVIVTFFGMTKKILVSK